MAGVAGINPFYSCRKCRTPVALRDDLLSKKFVAKYGGAYMFTRAMNIVLGQKQDRQLITGKYDVSEVFCSNCNEYLGWKYIRSYDTREKYKEGRFVIEKAKILKEY
ncbi:hypothetical protein ACH5RR_019831 [Cinchona calisaya]|uniref:Protein yippee-like n=1 Tax=Cinchona calisaya TaxID=153742 RepID=A0ABD2ZQI2_9GENT